MVTYGYSDGYESALDALGDGTRRTILELVAKEPRSVGDIAAELPISRPAVSQHLKILARAGLVAHRQEGTRRYYSADPSGFAELHRYIESFWQQALGSFKSMVEEE